MIDQKCHEWRIKMWTATIDFMKVFDSLTHIPIWNALKSCSIEHDYISLLRKLYRDQKTSVPTDDKSNMFEIKNGTKQGDPQSSLLFNTVQQNSLKDDIQRWQKKKGMGIYLSNQDRDCLTNMRFADDVLLFASSKDQFQKMLCEFKRGTEKVGLRIHPGKTKILSNQEIDDIKVEMLTREESTKYLGQLITFQQQETTEIRKRIRAAWATFHKHRQELTSRNYMLRHRLRLFDAAITPTICYASGTWAPTKEHERMIQSTQRKKCSDSSCKRKEDTKRS